MNSDEECLKDRDKLGLPADWKIPFFSYGFFKPEQLAFSQIQKYVKKDIKSVDIKAKLKHVNGMPVLVKEFNDRGKPVKGYVLKFFKRNQKAAYKTIANSKDMHIYSWDTLKINGKPVNVLVSADPEKLKNVYDDPEMPKYLRNWNDYNWEKDPVYDNALRFLDSRMEELGNKIYYGPDLDSQEISLLFVETQSLYMVLWSALDRFLTFRYGKSPKQNVISLSDEEFFKESLSNRVKREHTVTSSQNLKQVTLDADKSLCSAFYYYTLRNNVVHSGKMNVDEVKMLFDALFELRLIFMDVIEAVKNEKYIIRKEFNYDYLGDYF